MSTPNYLIAPSILSANFAKLGEAMRAGASIPGATLDNGGRTLTIRTK